MSLATEALENIKRDFQGDHFTPSGLTHLSARLAYYLRKAFPAKETLFPEINETLQDFYEKLNPIPVILSAKYINATISEILQICDPEPKSKPEITYIVPIHGCQRSKLIATLSSLASQIGVSLTAILIIDGPCESDYSIISEVLPLFQGKLNILVLQKSENGGVAKARNSGMKAINTPFFSWLDSHDIIHPLRSLHAIAYINNKGIDRLNTSYSRISIETNKLYLRNWKMSHCGHTSFVSRSHLIQKFGYLMDFKSHEDTEYQQRLEYYKANMHNTNLVGHYLDFTINNKSNHLSKDTWASEEIIEDHSILGGSYEGAITDERRRINAKTFNIYEKSMKEISEKYFPCIE